MKRWGFILLVSLGSAFFPIEKIKCAPFGPGMAPRFSDAWRICASLLSRQPAAPAATEDFNRKLEAVLRLKITQRILFDGSPLSQPQEFWIVKPNEETYRRAVRRSATQPRTISSISVVGFPGVLNDSTASWRLSKIIHKIRTGEIPLPLVFKTGRSILGSGVVMIESGPHHSIRSIRLRFPYTSEYGGVGPFKSFPKATSFLISLENRFKENAETALAEIQLSLDDSRDESLFTEFITLLSIDELGVYDPGHFESKLNLIRADGRAFEIRYSLLLDPRTDEFPRAPFGRTPFRDVSVPDFESFQIL
jgi:hypothetical protein